MHQPQTTPPTNSTDNDQKEEVGQMAQRTLHQQMISEMF